MSGSKKSRVGVLLCSGITVALCLYSVSICYFAMVDVRNEKNTLQRINDIHSRQLLRIFEKYNYTLNDVSYWDVLMFICFQDNTDEHIYIEDEYVCRHFAYDLIANATVAGLRCGYVVLNFQDGTAHAIVAFNTLQQGIIFVDPQCDVFVDVGIGVEYYEDSIITGYTIIWNDNF